MLSGISNFGETSYPAAKEKGLPVTHAYFGKRHDNVLNDINRLLLEIQEQGWFIETQYETKTGFGNRSYRAFDMTRDEAEHFGKLHKNVLQDIDNLIEMDSSIELNFQPKEIEVKTGFGTRKVRAFDMTRDGFTNRILRSVDI